MNLQINKNKFTYTQGEMNRSMATNRFTLDNNCNLRDAYTNQLFNQPSLTERVREQLEQENHPDSQDERVDELLRK